MLVLSRKLGEKVYIGNDIVITITYVDRGKVKLGIEAPEEIQVFRQELLGRADNTPERTITGVVRRKRRGVEPR